MDDQDWLEQRLAIDKYIPDDGFTAGVIDRLPAPQARPMVARRLILVASAFTAVCLAAVLIMPLFHTIQEFTARRPVAGIFLGLTSLIQKPAFLISAAVGMTALAFASIPLLRRWA